MKPASSWRSSGLPASDGAPPGSQHAFDPSTSIRFNWTLYARPPIDETLTAANNALNGYIESP